MAKIPFDIKFRPQIESGEYKVVDEDDHNVRIICWDKKSGKKYGYHIVGLVEFGPNHEECTYYTTDGKACFMDEHPCLFLVTPEKELTEFEDGLRQICEDAVKEAAVSPYRTSEDFAKRHSAELLALAIDARAKELSEGLKQSKLDKDSIPYHLIEFMCNLYTCQNWKESEETAELYATRLKAAAMKDLPRWRKWKNGACGNGQGIPIAIVKRGLNGYELVDALGITGEQYIMLFDLEKLSKED